MNLEEKASQYQFHLQIHRKISKILLLQEISMGKASSQNDHHISEWRGEYKKEIEKIHNENWYLQLQKKKMKDDYHAENLMFICLSHFRSAVEWKGHVLIPSLAKFFTKTLKKSF